MNIVSLSPTVTEILLYLGVSSALKGVTEACEISPELIQVALISNATQTADFSEPVFVGTHKVYLNKRKIQELQPQVILGELTKGGAAPSFDTMDSSVQVTTVRFDTLEHMYQGITTIGRVVGLSEKASSLINRIKAQSMDWADNFYQRTKNKKVSVISAVSPLSLAGFIIPDLIKLFSAEPQFPAGEVDRPTSWKEMHTFRSDVIVVAPRGAALPESMSSFKKFEKESLWEEIPAVKRGEVIFMDGTSLYAPGPRILDGIAMLVSAIAGLESGYITPRDSFRRLRYLELNRHTL